MHTRANALQLLFHRGNDAHGIVYGDLIKSTKAVRLRYNFWANYLSGLYSDQTGLLERVMIGLSTPSFSKFWIMMLNSCWLYFKVYQTIAILNRGRMYMHVCVWKGSIGFYFEEWTGVAKANLILIYYSLGQVLLTIQLWEISRQWILWLRKV